MLAIFCPGWSSTSLVRSNLLYTTQISLKLFICSCFIFVFIGCADENPLPNDSKGQIEWLFNNLSSNEKSAIELGWNKIDPVLPNPMVFQKPEFETLMQHCNERIKTLRLFLNDVYVGNKDYKNIPYIDEIFAHIALQNGYWDGEKNLDIDTIFNQLLPYPMNDQTFIYGCDIVKGSQNDEPPQYYIIEDSVTGALGGLQELPEFHWLLEEHHPSFKKFKQYSKIKETINEFIKEVKKISVLGDDPKLIVLSYESTPKTKFLSSFKDAGFSLLRLTFSPINLLANTSHKLINLTYYDSFDAEANQSSFYHNLLLRINFKSKYYVSKETFTTDLANPRNYKSEREEIGSNKFLVDHSLAIKNENAHVVSPLSGTSMFDHKLYGIMADKLAELYGTTSPIKNLKTRFFYSYQKKTLDQDLFEEVFDGDGQKWVVKKTVGVGGHGIYILHSLSHSEISALKSEIIKNPSYFFAQPFLKLARHEDAIYEVRIIGLSLPHKTIFYPVPFVRGVKSLKAFKTNIGSGGRIIPSFVVNEEN